jgi:hypothetical protein
LPREALIASALAALGALAACGPAQPPESLPQLESIQGKLAATSLRAQQAHGQLAAAAEVESQRRLEVERLTSAISAMEQLLARDRMRRHVEAVIDASRRRAAAAEEQDEGARQGDARLGEARLEIGREMLGRSRVEATVLGALVAARDALEEQKAVADGAGALAEQAFEREDLAAVQERVEEIGATAHRAFVWAFEGSRDSPTARITDLVARITAAGFTAVPDDYGAAVSLAGAGKKGKALCADAARLVALDTALLDAPKHAVVMIDPDGARPFPGLDLGKGRCPVALVVPLPEPP